MGFSSICSALGWEAESSWFKPLSHKCWKGVQVEGGKPGHFQSTALEQGTEIPNTEIGPCRSWWLIQGCTLLLKICSWDRLQHDLPKTWQVVKKKKKKKKRFIIYLEGLCCDFSLNISLSGCQWKALLLFRAAKHMTHYLTVSYLQQLVLPPVFAY